MVTRTKILEMVANGENSGVEFKCDVLQNQDLAKELVAFSNLDGGMLLLGVDDDGTIVGLTRERMEEWVMTTCRDKIRPSIIPFFMTIKDVHPGMDVAVVQVPRGFNVHSVWHNNKHNYYIRVGSQSREPSPEELSRLFQQRRMLRADILPISGSKINDLDFRRLKNYFGEVRQQDIPNENDDIGWRTLLINAEIMVDDNLTLLGMLLFGNNPNRFLPQSGIDTVAFPGLEKEYAAKERKKLRGPMTPIIDSHATVLEAGLVEQALEFVRRNTTVTAELIDGARRVERWTYPDEAVREALVNALIHRDYLLANTDIELAIYQNRLEIISPGKLPNGITPESMRIGARTARNELLKDVMRDYGYLEHMGMGVPRKIVRGMKEHNKTDPDLVEDGERFIVRLFAGIQQTKL